MFMETTMVSNFIKWLIKIPLFLQMKAYWKRTEERSRILRERNMHSLGPLHANIYSSGE
jgi:hypothetical protein